MAGGGAMAVPTKQRKAVTVRRAKGDCAERRKSFEQGKVQQGARCEEGGREDRQQ
jgi:hypothetical protein